MHHVRFVTFNLKEHVNLYLVRSITLINVNHEMNLF